jgi:hypothetical protein
MRNCRFESNTFLTAVTLLENPNPRRTGSPMRAPGGAS